MNPEEKIDRELWYVLKQVKEEALRTRSGNPVEYWVNFDIIGGNIPIPENEVKALEKLEEFGVIEILNPGGTWDYE